MAGTVSTRAQPEAAGRLIVLASRVRWRVGQWVAIPGEHSVGPSTRWETIMGTTGNATHREPWNKGKIVGQKAPFKLKDI